MAGKKGNKNHANKTSYTSEQRSGVPAYEIWTEAEVIALFEKMAENAKNDDEILCLQDAIFSVNLYGSSVNYLLEKFPKFEKFKKDVQDVITSRINKGALTGRFKETASIWRMKQLGEKDTQYQEGKQQVTLKTDVENLTTEELIKRAQALRDIETNGKDIN